MAGKESSQEKTEDPTQKKKDDAKKKGQVTRSKELVIYLMLMASTAIIILLSPEIYQGIKNETISSFTFTREMVFDKTTMLSQIIGWIDVFSDIMIPILGITLVVAIVSSIMLGGWVMSIESVRPKMEKLSFAKGLKRIFSSKGLMEFVKSVLKVILLGFTAYLLMQYYIPDIYSLGYMSLETATLLALEMIGYFFLFMSSVLVLVVMIDVPFQIHSSKKELMMTKQEIKDEMKDSEGRPEVKAKRREVSRKLAFSRQMESVPEADVIITNPTHYSIAIKYDGTDDAPVVIAMGTDILALKIRTIAKQYGVNIVESPPLARSLYYFSNIGEPIHPGLYDAVAKILSYVYRLRDYKDRGGSQPKLSDIDINQELRK